MSLNPYERAILSVLLNSRRSLTTGEIAERSRISWNTAEKYLKYLMERGWVKRSQWGSRYYWKAIVKHRY
ncbi:winged helix-turn-helix transcriptional regulator [Candidatus Woesearchaeota archaeon]|nr:winged helix-turn-helix transcriptional regulator [Candidatus Woesearchaeota archaeon]HIH25764.1 TrmB family transcriptional regulator [Nanoarchaeota archaeon]